MSTRLVPTSMGALMPPMMSPLIPIRNAVCLESFRPDVREILSWLANSDEHFVYRPAASSRPVVALICGGAIVEITKSQPFSPSYGTDLAPLRLLLDKTSRAYRHEMFRVN